jgi:hypothetical protein
MLITFTDTTELLNKEFYPKPASAFIPDWYKELESYRNNKKAPNGDGVSAATIKRCMPVFDAITSGYIIVSAADVYVSQQLQEDGTFVPYFEWVNLGLIEFHPIWQAPTHPNNNGHKEMYPKWTNPWGIKTPKGYSVLFTQPFHRESPFTILDGVVDTDSYYAPVNFPFVLNDITFEGLIPAGTPIAQVIPFKRENWKMELGASKELKEIQKDSLSVRSKFFDGYKTLFRKTKEYK